MGGDHAGQQEHSGHGDRQHPRQPQDGGQGPGNPRPTRLSRLPWLAQQGLAGLDDQARTERVGEAAVRYGAGGGAGSLPSAGQVEREVVLVRVKQHRSPLESRRRAGR